MKTRTIVAAGLLTTATAHAQAIVPDGFGGFYDPQEPQPYDYYEGENTWRDMADRAAKESGFGRPYHETDEYRSWDRLRAKEGCNALTNNARARELCLQGLR